VSEPLKSIHVRLSPEAHRALAAIADLEEKENAELARLILEEALLGRVHTVMLTARRYAGLGFSGIQGDSKGAGGRRGE
jgi:hypothetical protein